jgi:hypothetical protein
VTTIVTTGLDPRGDERPRNREAETGPDVTSSGRGDLNPGPPAPEAEDERCPASGGAEKPQLRPCPGGQATTIASPRCDRERYRTAAG